MSEYLGDVYFQIDKNQLSLVESKISSIYENEIKAKEIVAKKISNVFGYPHNIEVYTYQHLNRTDFVNSNTSEILACVETINNGIVFYTEVKYYGDWWK